MPFSYFKDFMVLCTHSSLNYVALLLFSLHASVSIFLAILVLGLGIWTEADGGEWGESSTMLSRGDCWD